MRVGRVVAVLGVVGCALFARAVAQECVGFLDLVVTDEGTNGVEALAVADLDGDGDVDLLTASYGDGRVRWHENTGAGQFVAREISDDQPGASDVFAADLDGDGVLDVLSTSRTNGRVSWFWSFDEPGRPPVFQQRVVASSIAIPLAVFAADLDGDGDEDVLSAGFDDDTIAWYENDGLAPPTFAAHDISTAADGAADVLAADLDGDADIDVISASRLDGEIVWYENDGEADPEFTAHTIGVAPGATTVFAADLDGDMDRDLAVGSLGDATVAWYENQGGTPLAFVRRVVSATVGDPVRVVAADVDGDGRNDLLTASRTADAILWHRNLGGTPPGFDTVVVSSTAVSAQAVAAADLDGDGETDVVSTSSVPGFPATLDEIAWYENQGTEAFPEHAVFQSADGAIAAVGADFDGDGDTDVATAGRTDKVAWQRNDGGPGPSFTEVPISAAVGGASALVAVDFDGDLDTDLVSAGAESGMVMWHENDGSGSFTDRPISSAEAAVYAIDVEDVDSDGHLDVLAALPASDTVVWLESDGATPPVFTRHVVVDDADGVSGVDAGDLDGDGDVDLAVTSAGDSIVAWFESDGAEPPAFTRRDLTTDTEPMVGASAVLVVDLDEDGDLDIAAAAAGNSTLAWYANDGVDPLPGFARRVITTGVPGISAVVTADFDADGDPDLAAAVPGSSSVFWFENSGASPPVLGAAFVTASGDELTVLSVADVDRDGLPDIVAGQRRVVSWFRALNEICQEFDASGDGRIDGVELAWLGRAFGSKSADPALEWWGPIDLDRNGEVDGSDLSILVTPGVFTTTPDECVYVCVP